MRFCATDDYLIHNFVTCVDKDSVGTVQSVAQHLRQQRASRLP